MLNTSFAGINNLYIPNGETVLGGDIKTYTARNSIEAGTSFVVESGGDATFRAGSGGIALKPGFHAKNGAKFAAKFWYDSQGLQDNKAPTVVDSYPTDGENVANDGSPLELRVIFADDDSGIYSVKLYEDGVEVQATIGGSYNDQTLSYIITNPVEQTYIYTVVLEDMAGNTDSIDISFTVDNDPPVTTASPTGGTFSGPFTVTLSSDEAGSTIYYSTDNYPPFVNSSNTDSGVSPIVVTIDRSMNLQFFAKDTAGNIETTTKSEVYLLGAIPDALTITLASFDSGAQRVELSWNAASGQISGYHLYRCLSPFDVDILNQSRNGGYPPPARLRIGALSTPTSSSDPAIVSGVTYFYGVTAVDANGTEGVISPLVPIDVDSTTSGDSDPSMKAMAWLESTQSEEGYWDDKRRLRMLATSQVLNAYKLMGKDDAGTHHALFYLRGHFADNNDYLARKMILLADYGQNVDEMVNRLIAQSQISGTQIQGWGVRTRLLFDAVSTALGAKAADLSTRSIDPMINEGRLYLAGSTYLDSKNFPDRFGWVRAQDPSVFVSCLVYNIVEEYYGFSIYNSSWISDYQNGDGSFGNGLIDTCAAIMWIDDLGDGGAQWIKGLAAYNYILDKQSSNGSWNDDPYLTGLCIEALEKSGYAP